MIKDYFSLSLRNLRHRGIRSWLTLLGIFIGITAVVSLISLGNGLQLAVSSQFGVSSTELISIQASGTSYGPPGSGAVSPLTTEDLEAVEKLSSVKIAVGRNIETGKLEYNNIVIFGYATNIPDGKYRDFVYEQLEAETVAGRLLKDGETGKVLLGYNFYVDKVGLEKPVVPGKKVKIQNRSFVVEGIIEKKGSFIFDNMVFMNNEDLEDLFDYGNEVGVIGALPREKGEIERTKEDIEKLLRSRRNVKIGEEDFEVSTPEASLDQVNSILGGVQAFIVIIAFISIFVGAIGIVNTMTTSVLERRKEIGTMKAVGARNSNIFYQFFVESSLLGLVGGLAGALFGTLIGVFGTIALSNWLGVELGIKIDFLLIIASLLGSFTIGGIAGIVPALNAAKQNPVEALRG